METQEKIKIRPDDATGEISLMGANGDSKHYWNKDNPDEVKIAGKVFKRYMKLSYQAYRMNPRGDRGEPIQEFDPAATCVLFVPPFAGG